MECERRLVAFTALLFQTVSVLVIPSSSTGPVALICSHQPIIALAGNDVILPCRLEPAADADSWTVEWTKPDLSPKYIHVHEDGRLLYQIQNPSYYRRTELFGNELMNGNVSIKIFKVKPSDGGKYICIIPSIQKEAVVQLIVGVVSSPVVKVTKATLSGVELQCESEGWYPQPEVLWLDAEGNLLSAGPTETVRGPDDLYTVSSRVTVEKRHSNSFTCRVQQKDINQTRETHIHVPDDFFIVPSSSSLPVIIGLAVSLAVCVVFILVFVLRKAIIKTKRNNCDETDGEKKNTETEKLMTKKTVPMEDLNKVKVEKTKDPEESEPEESEHHNPELKSQMDGSTDSPSHSSTTGHIFIEVDQQDKYICLKNQTNEEQQLKDWEIHLQINNRKPNICTFNYLWLKAKNTATIWPSDAGVRNNPPTDVVWSGQKSWSTGDKLLVTVYNSSGEVEARKELDSSQKTEDSSNEHIFDFELKDNCVHLHNISTKDQQLEGLQIYTQVNNSEPITYTMNSFNLKAGKTVSTNIKKYWSTGDKLLVTVFNHSGEELSMEKVYTVK